MTEFSSNLWIIAKDVKIQIEFNPNVVSEYKLIGYSNRRLTKEDFENDKKDAGEMGFEHTVTEIYEIKMKSDSSYVIDITTYTKTITNPEQNNEICKINVRYKMPNSGSSLLLQKIVKKTLLNRNTNSADLKFISAIVALEHFLKKDSTNTLTIAQIIELAKAGKGTDCDENRAEFIRLLEKFQLINEFKKPQL